jgi:hypothetical protein
VQRGLNFTVELPYNETDTFNATVVAVETLTWYSDLALVVLDEQTLQPKGNLVVVDMRTTEGGPWVQCRPQPSYQPSNQSLTQIVVVGPQDPRLALQSDNNLSFTFFSYPLATDPAAACLEGGRQFIASVTPNFLSELLHPSGSALPLMGQPVAPVYTDTPLVTQKNWIGSHTDAHLYTYTHIYTQQHNTHTYTHAPTAGFVDAREGQMYIERLLPYHVISGQGMTQAISDVPVARAATLISLITLITLKSRTKSRRKQSRT